ncbi:hypothetical protein U1Q18_001145, partial [Sarracenia purpurea var. burkii]
ISPPEVPLSTPDEPLRSSSDCSLLRLLCLPWLPISMSPPLYHLLLIISLLVPSKSLLPPADNSFISILISQNGLDFVKDLLVTKAISSLTPLKLPQIEKKLKIPVVGNVRVVLSDIIIYRVDVSSSHVKPGDTGVVIVASGTTCNLTMNWYYSYSTWFVPVKVSDSGSASVQV